MHKIIVAGCGSMSRHWIEFAKGRAGCEIVALVDSFVDSAREKQEKYGLDARVYGRLAEALEKEAATLLFDTSPPEAHCEIVTTALSAGLHVFGEKPMSDSLSDAEAMLKCAERTGKEYFVMQNRRYERGIRELRDFLASKELGAVGQISANFQLNPHFGGFREEMESPLVADMAIHTFDAARLICGQNAASVYCHEWNPSWSWYLGAANAVCIFEMEGGSVFDYRGSWCANGLNTTWESEWRITCAEGSVYWDGGEELYYGKSKAWADKSDTPDIFPIAPVYAPSNGHDACITEMFETLEHGRRPQTDCRDNIHSIRMVQRAIESARTGRKVLL